MSFTIPADFTSTIRALLVGAGDLVVFKQQDGGPSIPLIGSVQRPGVATLVGDAIQEGYIVFLPGDAFGSLIPARFDRLEVHGEDRAIEEALPIEAGGRVHAWQLRVLG